MDFSERRKEVKVIRKFQSYILVGFPPPLDSILLNLLIFGLYMLGKSRNCKHMKRQV